MDQHTFIRGWKYFQVTCVYLKVQSGESLGRPASRGMRLDKEARSLVSLAKRSPEMGTVCQLVEMSISVTGFESRDMFWLRRAKEGRMGPVEMVGGGVEVAGGGAEGSEVSLSGHSSGRR